MCGQAGVALSQLQKIGVIEAALLEFDGFEAQMSSLACFGEILDDVGWPSHEHEGH
jgi:hypothetical protein